MLVRIVGLGPGDARLLTVGALESLRAIGRAVALLAPPDLSAYLGRERRPDRARTGRRSGAVRARQQRGDRALRQAPRGERCRRPRVSACSAIRSRTSPGCRRCCARLEAAGIATEIVPGVPRATLSASIAMPLVPLPPQSAHHSWDDLGRDHGAPAHGLPVGSRADASHARAVPDRRDIRSRRSDRGRRSRRACAKSSATCCCRSSFTRSLRPRPESSPSPTSSTRSPIRWCAVIRTFSATR